MSGGLGGLAIGTHAILKSKEVFDATPNEIVRIRICVSAYYLGNTSDWEAMHL